ncbi:hypothetical protein PV11_07357 [Exophiala sideris]|uniref:Uncharacterized protein n=1 Tax=Exophiala sideris TaxID=1016849 RepID=A0A0D1YA04_9EURO|nr:hypothetical protein PV11_07357 [Exophiala sideris]
MLEDPITNSGDEDGSTISACCPQKGRPLEFQGSCFVKTTDKTNGPPTSSLWTGWSGLLILLAVSPIPLLVAAPLPCGDQLEAEMSAEVFRRRQTCECLIQLRQGCIW